MGRALIDLIRSDPEFDLAGITLAPGKKPSEGSSVPQELYGHSISHAVATADVLVDFTTPASVEGHADACARSGTAWVVGTTGLDSRQQGSVAEAADIVPVCQSANFSTGVNLMLRLVELATRASELSTDLEIIEAHHRHKVDAPSGTALAIGEAMAAGRGMDLDAVAVTSREGNTGARPQGAIGFSTVRGGDIVGEHTALFASEGERLEITHRAGTRQAFARGALRAAHWIVNQPRGLYDMQDVLQLRA